MTEKELIRLISETNENNHFNSEFSKLLDTKLLNNDQLYFLFSYLIVERPELFTAKCSYFLPQIKNDWLKIMMTDKDEELIIDWATKYHRSQFQISYNLYGLFLLERPKLSEHAATLLFNAIIDRHRAANFSTNAGLLTSGDWSVYRIFENYPEANIGLALLAIQAICKHNGNDHAMRQFLEKYPEAEKFISIV